MKTSTIAIMVFVCLLYLVSSTNAEMDLSAIIIDSSGNRFELNGIISHYSNIPSIPDLPKENYPMLLRLMAPGSIDLFYWIKIPLINNIVIEEKDLFKVTLHDHTEFIGTISGELKGHDELGETTIVLGKNVQKILFSGGTEFMDRSAEVLSDKPGKFLSGTISLNNKKFALQTITFYASNLGYSDEFIFLRGPSKTPLSLTELSTMTFTGNQTNNDPEIVIVPTKSGKTYRGGLDFNTYPPPELVGKTSFGAISIRMAASAIKDKVKVAFGELVTAGKLFIETIPENANVNILNIEPEFHQGIELNPGKYTIEVSANGYPKKTQEVTIGAGEEKHINIQLESIVTTRKSYAVIVGISRYLHPDTGLTNLSFADDDARTFADMLQKMGWSSSHIKTLVNEEATQKNILIALESWLTKAGQDDVIVLFWAGHGFPDPEDPEKVYFACYDTDMSIPATGYRMDRIRDTIEERNAKNVVMLADTCHAGKLITREDERGRLIKFKEQFKDVPKGWIFMVGADTDRQAIEHSSWSNGAFTHCLLKALSGEADGYESVGPKDGVVTMGEIRAYMESFMPEETLRVLGIAKHPVITTSTGDPDIWELSLQVK